MYMIYESVKNETKVGYGKTLNQNIQLLHTYNTYMIT